MRRTLLKIVPILVAIVLIMGMSACANSPRTTYVSVENQFASLAQQYLMWRDSGQVPEDVQDRVEKLFSAADTTLDLYKVSVLSGAPTGDLYMELNRLKTQLFFELSKK